MKHQVDISVEALKHISQWVRGCTLGGIMMHDELLMALDRADIDQRLPDAPEIEPPVDGKVSLTSGCAEALLDLDMRAHGYGTNRALRSDREDCDLCVELGRALEQMIPRLAVRRTKDPQLSGGGGRLSDDVRHPAPGRPVRR